MGMLDGKEIEGKIGDVGGYFVDVTKEGIAEIGVQISAKFAENDVEVQSTNSAKAHILAILDKIAKKNDRTWDEAAIASVRNILGIVG